jgi:zinc finger protein
MECPHCGSQLKIITNTIDIPYFGAVLQSTFLCSCGYRFIDIFPFEEHPPSRYTLTITGEELLSRVVKSSTCIIEVPELGVRVDPGPRSEGIVTNVEGILKRIEYAVKTGIHWGNNSQKKEGKEIIKKIQEILDGSASATLILEDPRGFSCIISRNVQRKML